MKAIVLCAGRGGRLRPLTEDIPKCLLNIGGKTILECCLENLRASGIQDIILVTGYMKELVEKHVNEKRYQGISFVYNERYAGTNTAYSLNLALKEMDADFIIINGDVLFDKTILEDLIQHPTKNCIAVDADILLDQEEIKVIAQNGHVEKISKELDPRRSLGEAIGLYKISRVLIPDLIRLYDGLEVRGELHHFFEKGFDKICKDGGGEDRLFGISFTHRRPWVEIDTIEDFDYARREIFPRICG